MKIRKSDKEIIKLTTKHLLFGLFDIVAPAYLTTRTFRRPIKKYLEQRAVDYSTFLERIKYLKRQGYIETFVEGKEKYAELTPKGKTRINELLLDDLEISRSQKWDHKWRVVIFDIPDDKKYNRDVFRERLLNLGFVSIQESVYVYPFKCANEISLLSGFLFVKDYVVIMVSEIIQGEEEIIADFLDKKILQNSDLK